MWLCSPETAVATALTEVITDPRELGEAPQGVLPDTASVNTAMLVPPPAEPVTEQLVKGPNISALPELDPLPSRLSGPVLVKAGDDVSTDEISPAGARALPLRSNIAALSEFTFTRLDETYPQRAAETGQHVVVGGRNYGQGSSREHAAITPRYLGLRVVLARSFARIHWQNLVNFGILPLEFAEESGYDAVAQGDELRIEGLREAVRAGGDIPGNKLCSWTLSS